MAENSTPSNATPVQPPGTGFTSVRVGAYLAQLVVTLTLTYFIRRNLLSPELAERLRARPEFLEGVQLLAEGLTLLALALQGWVTHTFIKVSGLIAQKKLEIIGAYHTQLVKAASPNPPAQSEVTITEKKEI